MANIFSEYPIQLAGTSGNAFDEMFPADPHYQGQVHPEYAEVHKALAAMPQTELQGRTEALARSYLAQGITFDFAGQEHPFPLDAVPRVISTQQWDHIERGVKQRVQALEAFLADAYGSLEVVKDGIIPASVIASAVGYYREASSIPSPNGVRIQVAGIDLIRDESGTWRVLEDNVRVPSGVSYVMSNRRVMAQTLPELFSSMRIQSVAHYPNKLLAALKASAPNNIENPTVVVLTPGVYNSAYYEHTLLARSMGIELVEGRDLYCAEGYVWMRTTKGPAKVDVIYRRIDDDFIDPMHFRADSVLGCPGLMAAARRGHVTIANAIGNGVADDKLIYTYVPELIKYYLGQEPILPNVKTWRLAEPEALAEVWDQLNELVIKPVDGSGGKGLVMGPNATKSELETLKQRLKQDPRGWIAQPVIQLSTIPTLVKDGLKPRHSDLRPFAVNNGTDIYVLPGGLTRVALPEGQLVVNSSQGGGSKDTWVIGNNSPIESTSSILDQLIAGEIQPTPIPPLGSHASMLQSPQDSHARQQQQQQQQNQ